MYILTRIPYKPIYRVKRGLHAKSNKYDVCAHTNAKNGKQPHEK